MLSFSIAYSPGGGGGGTRSAVGFFFRGFYRLLVVAADEGQAGTRHNEGQEQIADSCNVNRGVMRALASRNGNETVQSPV